MRSQRDAQREEDAAFFEDWSEWASLTGKFGWFPEERDSHGNIFRRRQPYGTYRVELTTGSIIAPGQPGFELVLPPHHAVNTIVRRDAITILLRQLPDLHQHPKADWEARNVAYHRLRNTYFVPARHWRAVRAVLPALKAAVIARVESRR